MNLGSDDNSFFFFNRGVVAIFWQEEEETDEMRSRKKRSRLKSDIRNGTSSNEMPLPPKKKEKNFEIRLLAACAPNCTHTYTHTHLSLVFKQDWMLSGTFQKWERDCSPSHILLLHGNASSRAYYYISQSQYWKQHVSSVSLLEPQMLIKRDNVAIHSLLTPEHLTTAAPFKT